MSEILILDVTKVAFISNVSATIPMLTCCTLLVIAIGSGYFTSNFTATHKHTLVRLSWIKLDNFDCYESFFPYYRIVTTCHTL